MSTWLRTGGLIVLGLVVAGAISVLVAQAIVDAGPAPITQQLPGIGSSDREDLQLKIEVSNAHTATSMLWLTKVALSVSIFSTIALAATVAAALLSLHQAQEVTRLQDRTTRAQLRAYLWITGRVEDAMAGKEPILRLVLQNSGATPAYNVRTQIAFSYQSASEDEALDYSLGPEFDAISIQPGSTANIRSRLRPALTAEQVRELEIEENHKGHILTAVGRVSYKDSFGDEHSTGFAWFFHGKKALKTFNLPQHNWAD